MATLKQIQALALGNPDFKQRFAASRVQAVWNIFAETSPPAPRVAWRDKILEGAETDLDREYLWFLQHPNIQTGGTPDSIPDAKIVEATMSFIDAWAAYDAAKVVP